jgi:hypothetical protein
MAKAVEGSLPLTNEVLYERLLKQQPSAWASMQAQIAVNAAGAHGLAIGVIKLRECCLEKDIQVRVAILTRLEPGLSTADAETRARNDLEKLTAAKVASIAAKIKRRPPSGPEPGTIAVLAPGEEEPKEDAGLKEG